ncbi:MAG TPA: dihydrodipicolinate synthase family protein [Stellaceae bacterium]|nr:dihydrodipicolinate synthase family protein [Stellaceae bacterium]
MTDLPRGVLAALVTPLTDALEPDTAALVAHSRWLLGHGCTGLVALATAGEANSLSLAQRLRIVDAAANNGLPMAQMIIGGGSCALDEAATLTKAIAASGAAGVLLLPPFYYRDAGEAGLFRFYAKVIERVADPGLRIVLHHRPQASGAPITEALIRQLKEAFGAIIAGVQNGAGDWATTAALIRDFPALAVFSGTERFLLAALRAGGQGCISATLNFTAPLAGPIYRQWQGTAAVALQEELSAVRQVFDEFPTPAAQKEILARLTGHRGWRNLLPPLLPLAAARGDELAQQLVALPAWRTVLAAIGAA